MDQIFCEESAKEYASSDFKCEKVVHATDEPTGLPTPQKMADPLPKSKEAQTLLPEKYRTIADLFNHMSCSLRLLHLYKKSPTFQNVCKQVEVLAKRKFSYTHLAQMKYILSEGIQIDKVNVYDKKSSCMEPDMKITLVFEVVEEHSEPSADMALRQYFCSRLINFFNMHPEVTDIPEATLPVPFSQRTCNSICEDLPVNSSTELSSASNQIEPLPEKSHFSSTFSRHFVQQNVASETEEVQCSSSSKTSLSSDASDCPNNQESESTWQKGCSPLLSDSETNIYTARGKQEEPLSTCFQSNVINTPVHRISPPHSVNHSTPESQDVENVSCAEWMIRTPAQSAPGKLLPGSDMKHPNMTAQNSASCFKPAKRVLDFTLMEGNDGLDDMDNRAEMLDSSKALREFDCISEPSRGCSENCNSFASAALLWEVDENLGYSVGKTNPNQAGLDAPDKSISSLVDLVNVIDSIFGHVNRTPITKEEFLQKIIMNSLDIVEIREVEEQIEILEQLMPDWICKKLVSTGDTMYCIKNVLDLDWLRSRLLSNVTEGAE